MVIFHKGDVFMFWDNFIRLCENKGVSPNKVAMDLELSNATTTRWKKGSIPQGKTLNKIADYFSVNTDDLLGRIGVPVKDLPPAIDNIFPITRKAFPLLGDIACGEPIFADETRESYVMSGTDIQADFCLRAKGDSMIGARILDGDIVFIKKMSVVDNGSIAAVIIGDEATLKRVYYYPTDKKLVLNAENPRYEPFVFVGEELDNICILGKAVSFQSDVK